MAAGLRKKYLNKKTKEYDKGFLDWLKAEQLEELFGSLANFTKYAAAGDVVDYVASKSSNPVKSLKQLPLSVGALYEISQILTGKNGKDTFKLCLNFTASRKSLSEPRHEWKTKKPALIRPNTTESEVRNWRRKWFDPTPPKTKRTDKRSIPLATIYVSGELFDFDRKTGDKIGSVDLPDVEAFIKKLNKLFEEENALPFKLDAYMDYITEAYYAWSQKHDPAANIVRTKILVPPKPDLPKLMHQRKSERNLKRKRKVRKLGRSLNQAPSVDETTDYDNLVAASSSLMKVAPPPRNKAKRTLSAYAQGSC